MGYFWLSLAENFHQKNAGIMRNHQILATLITIFMSLSIGQIGANQPEKRPNILFIMSDDHAENAISAYGSDLIQTPNIDRLADEGMHFQQVVEAVRRELARQYLTGSSLELNEIAFLLGYEEASSFHRAFRHWEGTSPGQWRAAHH